MSLALSEDHRSLVEVARGFLTDRKVLSAARSTLDLTESELKSSELPPLWSEVCEMGWAGLHLPEAVGGQGYGFAELALILEELGRVVAPLPFLSSAIGSSVIDRAGSESSKTQWLRGLAGGEKLSGVGLSGSFTLKDGTLSGHSGPTLGASYAHVVLLAVGDDLVIVDTSASGVTVTPIASLDTTVSFANVQCSQVAIAPEQIITNGRRVAVRIARALASANAVGVARACLEASIDYAKIRAQFGRTIGTFQAVKHHAANMLVQIELATAATWDAARQIDAGTADQADLASATAASLALDAAQFCARKNIQLHGGIGFTWEHEAHRFLRRAETLAHAYDSSSHALNDVAQLVTSGITRTFGIDLPPEADAFRVDARAAVAKYHATPEPNRRDFLVESGYLMPHWPKPYGRGASAIEQLVIEEEFSSVEPINMGITGWVTLTIAQHGTDDQRSRWTDDALRGKTAWCQLFSEPDAGSDAAAIKTKGVRVDSGWKVSGQKVWTSGAHWCDMGFMTVRTDSDGPKHQGVSMMAVNMKAPGVEIRPLRELTGESLFNEVFFTDVFVPDDDVVGQVGQGWAVARATLGNERVSIGAGSRNTLAATELFAFATDDTDRGTRRDIAALVVEEDAMRLLNLRAAMRAVIGDGPGPEGNLTKLLSAEHAQRVTELGLSLAGTTALTSATESAKSLMFEHLFARCLSIAGGTSEITRNQIAERILGLPRDPLAK
jgi:3-oxochol-4-en-24-oyl-CoA dehydrogenase